MIMSTIIDERSGDHVKVLKPVIAVLTAVIIFFVLFVANCWFIDIESDSPYNFTTECGEAIDLGHSRAFLKGKFLFKNGIELPLMQSGTPDISKTGTYSIIYTAKFWTISNSSVKTVTIVDTTPPVIELVQSGTDVFLLPHEEYKEEGFSAYDLCDGDITDKVEVSVDGDTVSYSVCDSSGNYAYAERKLKFADVTPPVIELIGDKAIKLFCGSVYSEPGYRASDDRDGDLTASVVISSDIDTDSPGEYSVVYSVKDSFGNEARAIRTVTVEWDEPENPTGYIYLTFDDGPGSYTEELLDILARNNVKATFFIVASHDSPTITRIANEGHSLGIHCYEHVYKNIYASPDAYFEDLAKADKVVYARTGLHVKLIRFPGGSSNTTSRSYCKGIMTYLTAEVERRGYTYFDWNVSSKDASETPISTEEMIEHVTYSISKRKTSVILFHDTKKRSVDAIQPIIDWGKKNGYVFRAITKNTPAVHHPVNN